MNIMRPTQVTHNTTLAEELNKFIHTTQAITTEQLEIVGSAQFLEPSMIKSFLGALTSSVVENTRLAQSVAGQIARGGNLLLLKHSGETGLFQDVTFDTDRESYIFTALGQKGIESFPYDPTIEFKQAPLGSKSSQQFYPKQGI